MLNLQIEIFLLLGIGYFLSAKNIITAEVKNKLTTLSLSLILPCAIIQSFELDITSQDFISCMLVLISSICIQFFYGLLNLFLWRKSPKSEQTDLKYGTLVSNAGFFGMPIAQSAFGELGLLFSSFFLIPQRIVMWSAGLSLFTDHTSYKEMIKKVGTHPCIIALAIGLIVLWGRMHQIYLPEPLDLTISAIAKCNTPICMFVIGALLEQGDHAHLFSKEMNLYCFIRLIAIPLIIYGIMRWLALPKLAVQICTLESAMPAATTTAMLASKYNRNPEFASKMVFVSTLFSLITLPIWLWIL